MSIQEEYMTQILKGHKTVEFRKYALPHSVTRIWFYLLPSHELRYVISILPAVSRLFGDILKEDGEGNKEYNEWHQDYDGYDYAYRITGVWKLGRKIGKEEMKKYGFQDRPRGRTFLPMKLLKEHEQDLM